MTLTDLFHEQRLGRLPLPVEIKGTELKFGKTRGGGLGFSRVRMGHWEGPRWVEDMLPVTQGGLGDLWMK